MKNIERLLKLQNVILLAVFILLAIPAAAADGSALYASCSACHGLNGEGNQKIGAPNIGGMAKWYVVRQLENFSSGKRGADKADSFGAQMRAAALMLTTDAQRQALATHTAALPSRTAQAVASGDSIELTKGRNQFNAICSSCHASNARGNPALGAPSLVGLDVTYAERQLKAFREGQRGAHPDDKWGAQMRVGASMLADMKSGRDALAYIATLK
jgi:cytochrome c553